MIDLQYHFEFVAVFGAAPAFKKILNAANSPEQSKGLGGIRTLAVRTNTLHGIERVPQCNHIRLTV